METATRGQQDVKISPCTVRGQPRFKIELGTGSNRKRQFCKTQAEAELALDAARKDQAQLGRAWALLSAREKVEVMRILEEIHDAGRTLAGVWEQAQAVPNAPKTVKTLGEAVQETIQAKRALGRREDYLDGLELYLKAFVRGREATPVQSIGMEHIEAWFTARNEAPETRRSNQGRLSAMFDYCWRKYYIPENPCKRIEAPSIDKEAPVCLSVKQVDSSLCWVHANEPRFLGWLVLTLIVGLRPKAEADKIPWNKINLSRGRIRIDAKGTKTRQFRIIDLSLAPNAVAWLKRAKKIGSPLPLPRVTRRRYLRKLRDHLGFKRWPQSILRKTAASFLMAKHQDAGKIADFLGNSAGVLLKTYRVLKEREDAEKFYRLMPKKTNHP
jgi:hypothetical protein